MNYNNSRYYEPEDGDFDEDAFNESVDCLLASDGECYWANESNWYEALSQLELDEDYEPNTAPAEVIDKVKAYWLDIAQNIAEGDF